MENVYGLNGIGTSELNRLEDHFSHAMYSQIIFLMELNKIESIDFDKISNGSLYKPNIPYTDFRTGDWLISGLKLNHETHELSIVLKDIRYGGLTEKPYFDLTLFYADVKPILFAVENCCQRNVRKEYIEKGIIVKCK